MKENLGNKKVDLITSALKGSIGIVPLAGPFLQEIVSNIIPNQRLDRIAEFIKILNDKLNEANIQISQIQLQDENFTSLTEDAIIEVAKSTSKERKEYIASILKNGIEINHIDYLESKHLLKTLSAVNDVEIIILLSKRLMTSKGHNTIRKKYPHVFKNERSYSGEKNEESEKHAIHLNYKEHLSNLGLLKKEYSWKKVMNHGANDEFQLPKIQYKITDFGELFLKSIDLSEF